MPLIDSMRTYGNRWLADDCAAEVQNVISEQADPQPVVAAVWSAGQGRTSP